MLGCRNCGPCTNKWNLCTYLQLKERVLKGFPAHKNQLLETMKQYWQVQWELSIENDLILYRHQLLIPTAICKKTLAHLHVAHRGIVCTKQQAHLTFYWPGMDNDIENITTACTLCQNHLPSNHKEPLQTKPRPVWPFQEAVADLCSHAWRSYLVWVDCYSDWPIIAPMNTYTNATHLTTVCTEIFSQMAVPDVLRPTVYQ